MEPITSQSLTDLTDWAEGRSQPKYRAAQILEWIYRKRIKSFDEMSNLPVALRDALKADFTFAPLPIVRRLGSKDTTQKLLFQLSDEQLVESVIIPASPALYGQSSDRLTLCISSQVGCAYGCKFCASGLDGWSRNLNAGEIVDQILEAEREAGERIDNVVFMGMGEPLANLKNLLKALEIINSPWGIGIGARHLTISTSGLAPQIRELAEQKLQFRLAISLHGATDEVRNKIMPVNKKYPLSVLLDACRYWTSKKNQRITLEYILIAGINDDQSQAAELGTLANELGARVNLIPYNTVEGLEWQRPELPVQLDFEKRVEQTGAKVTLRREKGHDINAACGQLRRVTANSAKVL